MEQGDLGGVQVGDILEVFIQYTPKKVISETAQVTSFRKDANGHVTEVRFGDKIEDEGKIYWAVFDDGGRWSLGIWKVLKVEWVKKE